MTRINTLILYKPKPDGHPEEYINVTDFNVEGGMISFGTETAKVITNLLFLFEEQP